MEKYFKLRKVTKSDWKVLLEWRNDKITRQNSFNSELISINTHKEFIKAIKEVSGNDWEVGSIERQSFYEEAKKSYAIVTTTDARPFGCFIITKGVIKPDGSVWVLEK